VTARPQIRAPRWIGVAPSMNVNGYPRRNSMAEAVAVVTWVSV
jgi:hypothetical protein